MRPKIAFAVVLLSVLAHADSVVLNKGSAFVNGLLGQGGFSFNFYGHANSLLNVVGDEFFFGNDLYTCDGCPLPQNPFTLAFFSPPSFGIVNGTPEFLNGTPFIETISARIVQKGNRVFITGLAQARGGFMACLDLDCSVPGQFFNLGATPWRYRINFLNVGDGFYQFQSAKMQTVPEPGTLVLLGTGFLALGFSSRRRWNGHKQTRALRLWQTAVLP